MSNLTLGTTFPLIQRVVHLEEEWLVNVIPNAITLIDVQNLAWTVPFAVDSVKGTPRRLTFLRSFGDRPSMLTLCVEAPLSRIHSRVGFPPAFSEAGDLRPRCIEFSNFSFG